MRCEEMCSTFEEALEGLDGEELRAVIFELVVRLEDDVSWQSDMHRHARRDARRSQISR